MSCTDNPSISLCLTKISKRNANFLLRSNNALTGANLSKTYIFLGFQRRRHRLDRLVYSQLFDLNCTILGIRARNTVGIPEKGQKFVSGELRRFESKGVDRSHEILLKGRIYLLFVSGDGPSVPIVSLSGNLHPKRSDLP
jgi:hypothetical protein